MRTTWKYLIAGLALGAATASLAIEPQDAPLAVQTELIGLSASDFTEHGPAVQSVRNVHIRHETLSNGQHSYLLCGEFRTSADGKGSEWTHFATIKTDPYEQWIGAMAKAHCERATVTPSSPSDLSATLQTRLDAATSK